ncbi:MAG: LEPR-XLL domain-containing protein, partial [Verrucomicrobiae bacterium]|nr:LEPR-XLL domain-containing protein [Verrucomicrobiae bacterium]
MNARQLEVDALEPRVLFSGAPVEGPDQDSSADSAPSPEDQPQVDADAQAAMDASVADAAASAEATKALADSVTPSEPAEQSVTLVDTSGDTPSLNQETLDMIAQVATQRWIESGVDASQLAALSSISYQIADLPATQLGTASGWVITIDVNAWGQGWFVDATPNDNSEFEIAVSDTLFKTNQGAASEGIDLLSVILHEQGHVLGLRDALSPAETDNVMYQGFGPGQRRLPSAGQATGAIPGSYNEAELATFTPTIFTDGGSGTGSLRDAIIAANSAATDDIITLAAGTYTLSLAGTNEENGATGDLDIRNNGTLIIQGAGMTQTIIDAAMLDRVFDIFDGATVEFRDLTIQGGFLDYSHGAGMYARFGSTVTLTNVAITDNLVQTPNTANVDRHGGGIWSNQATITGSNVEITNNTAQKFGAGRNAVGGGMWISGDSTIDLTDVTITGNTAREGGGFYVSAGNFGGSQMTLTNAVINNNTGVVRGGGFDNAGIDSEITINGGTISSNFAQNEHGGGFYNYGTVNLNGVVISDNEAQDLDTGDTKRDDSVGGGFFNTTGTVVMTGGSITGNKAYGTGGGFYNRVGTVTLIGTAGDVIEIENNKAGAHDGLGDSRDGGGFYNTETGTVDLTYVTFTNNNVRFATAGDANTVTGLGAGFR